MKGINLHAFLDICLHIIEDFGLIYRNLMLQLRITTLGILEFVKSLAYLFIVVVSFLFQIFLFYLFWLYLIFLFL